MAERRIINPWNWQDRYGFVQANEIGNINKILICSGQTAIDAEGKAAYPDNIGAQLKMALDNLEEVLRKADFSLSDIVRMTIYTTDMNKLISAYEPTVIRLSHAKCRPAMTILEVSRLAFSELMVEIKATAIQ